MPQILIISEKPQAAFRIASAIAESEVQKVRKGKTYWFEFTKNNKKHVVVPAVGHLFVLDAPKGSGWGYPIFDPEWVPTFKRKGYEYTKGYYNNIKTLAERSDDFIIATDYDTEGEVIGYNILRFICNREDAKRMKFSTLTKPDLVESYDNLMQHMDLGQSEAGLTRHYLDFFWGINTTRALTLAMKAYVNKAFIVVSSGRVQSPTLKILADRGLEIKKFVPIPYCQLELHCLHDVEVLVAYYEKEKIFNKEEAQKIFNECQGKDALVKDLEKKDYKQSPPAPFDTTTLQIEAYKCFGFSPTQTMSIAESLYNQALISYPRTSSQKLPAKIGYKKIISNLASIERFSQMAQELLSKAVLKPVEGKKIDPAHIAIYPTGEIPKSLSSQEFKLYNLIVKRFFSVFGDPAIRETMKVILTIDNHKFILTGVKTINLGWIKYYSEFMNLKEQILPELKIGQILKVKELLLLEKETQPPNRYTQGSIINEMENRGLGTKATRAQILQTLYDRGYVKGKSIEVTDFGEKVVEVLSEFSPKIVSEELTRKFEDDMEMVSETKKKREEVINEAKKILTEILSDFKNNQNKIGEALSKSYISYKKGEKFMGHCPECGSELKIVVSRKTGKRFLGCSGYKDGCHFSTPLPQIGQIKSLDKECEVCGYPLIAIRFKGKKFFVSCTNLQCSTKNKNSTS